MVRGCAFELFRDPTSSGACIVYVKKEESPIAFIPYFPFTVFVNLGMFLRTPNSLKNSCAESTVLEL